MDFRIRCADAALTPDNLTCDSAWDSLSAAQAAYDAAPRVQLSCDEMETLLRWRSRPIASGTQARRGRAARTLNLRLYPESLEGRDVPTPMLTLTLLAPHLPAAAAAWDDDRAWREMPVSAGTVKSASAAACGAGAPLAMGRGQDPSSVLAIAHTIMAHPGLGPTCYASQPNDRALIELLATSLPSSRDLEPLAWCA